MSTRARIVRAMTELLRVQGYAATGVKQLSVAAEAPVGSIYHHFAGGKREIAAEVLQQTGAAYMELVSLLLDEHDDLPSAVQAAFAAAATTLETSGWVNMCPVGTVLGEVADSEPRLREVGDAVIGDWVERGTSYLAGRGLERRDARAATYALVSALEGAFVLARAQRSVEPLLAAGRATSAYVASLLIRSDAPAPTR